MHSYRQKLTRPCVVVFTSDAERHRPECGVPTFVETSEEVRRDVGLADAPDPSYIVYLQEDLHVIRGAHGRAAVENIVRKLPVD